MQSKRLSYLERLHEGKPVHVNWITATAAELRTIRRMWAEGSVECVDHCKTTLTATFTGVKK